jgi:hypothetical protein
MLVPLKPATVRHFGSMKGQIRIAADFDVPVRFETGCVIQGEESADQ